MRSAKLIMRPWAIGALLLVILAATPLRAQEIVVIVNPAAAPISREQLADLYLAKSSALIPIDQVADSPIYVEFYKKATGRDTSQVKATWSRILFTGRGVPPKQMSNSEAVKKAVAANPKAVGYIEKSAVDATVKVALALN
jgi:ABC-type phosphate transport system substrate-binding protein